MVDLVTVADLVPVPLWVSAGLQSTNWVNRAMVQLTGRSPDDHDGEGWLDDIHPDDVASYLALCREKWEANEPYEVVYRIRRTDGEWRWTVNRAVPFTSDAGAVGYIGANVDITDQVRAIEQIDTERRQLGVLVDVLSELVGVNPEALPAALTMVIERIGRFADVDRIGLVRIDHERRTMELEHAWHSHRVGPDYESQASISLDEHPEVARRLERHQIVAIDDVAAMPDSERVDREMLRGRGICANVVVPIVLGGVLNGLLFLDDHHRARQWDDLKPALQVLGHALAAALGRHAADRQERASEARFHALFDTNPLPMFVADPVSLRISEANRAAVDLYGDRHELIERDLRDLHPAAERDDAARLAADAGSGPRRTGPWRHVVRGGREIDVEISAQRVPIAPGSFLLFVVHDVTEQRRLERELRHQAFHDTLTGLPNRALLGHRLHRAIEGPAGDVSADDASVGRSEPAVILLDLDGFKTVNDSLGHQAGDRLLVQVADRLRRAVDEHHTVARLGGDEFAVIVPGPDALADARDVAERIERSLAEPIEVDGRPMVISASIGISHAGRDGHTADVLLRDADLAMFAAKDAGRGRTVEFDDDLARRAHERLSLETELRASITRGELVLHYQPTVDLDTGAIRSVEALVRWAHPTRGLLGPGHFLPAVEHHPLIEQIGEWVLDEACRQARAWRERCGWSPAIAVNVAPRQLAHSAFVEFVVDTLDRHAVSAEQLVLEITERSLLDDAASRDRLADLRAVGVRLAIDDFGTGYSSLGYLRDLPVDILKIDRSFVAAMDDGDEQSIALVAMVIELADVLGLDSVAEGIELDTQIERLRTLGCHAGQGYLIARPMPAAGIEELLEQHPHR
jgi:diguanylate cyclase (GGDEF)-like protein/PAS domain S-box-containing protein